MSFEWQLSTVGEFCPFKYGKGLPERVRKPGAFGVYSSAGLVGWHDTAYVNAPGIVVGRKGTVGSVTFSANPFWAIDTAFYVDDQPHVRDIHFTYYLLKTLDLHLMNTDSAVPGLNRDNAHAIEVRIPPLAVQKNIADFLRLLDDRITLLRETNSTLEAIAQALFKSWFVDFDPVRAKSEGKLPEGMDEATAALFPDAFEETELGMVPKGWQVVKISDSVLVTDYVANGSFASLKENVTLLDEPSYALYVRTTDFNSGFRGDFRYVDERAYKFLSKSALDGSEVIISNVGDVGTVFTPPSWLGLRMTLGSNAIALKAPKMSSYLYFHFTSNKGQHDIQSIVTGSAQLKFNKTNFRDLKILIPNVPVQANFEAVAGDLLLRCQMNKAQIKCLTDLRDALLPRLISGQLRIADAEAELEKVTA
jgi:type I restriction enzyme, S subunit